MNDSLLVKVKQTHREELCLGLCKKISSINWFLEVPNVYMFIDECGENIFEPHQFKKREVRLTRKKDHFSCVVEVDEILT